MSFQDLSPLIKWVLVGWYEKVPCQIWGVFIFECNFEIILAPLWSCNFAQCWIVNHGCSFGSVSAWSLKVRELKWLFSELSNIWSAQPEHVNVAKKNTFDLMFWVKCFFFCYELRSQDPSTRARNQNTTSRKKSCGVGDMYGW